MKRTVLICVLLLHGCGNQKLVGAVQRDVVKDFLDPDAAQFTDTKVISGETNVYVCGFVNGKNGFGAYVGRKPYWGSGPINMIWTHIVEDGSETPCEAFERTKDGRAADAAAQTYEHRQVERQNRDFQCQMGGRCLDENGLENSM